MGIRGTDIAKQAADILLLDDSFSSIITACKFGRNVYDSIRKFVQFQLTTNIVAVFMTLLGGVILKDSPLNAIQMLWVNLIMDSFASLALATEKPNDKLLERKPYKKTDSILTPFMKANILSQGLFQIIILLFILFKGDKLFGVNSDRELEHYEWNAQHGYHFTIFFNVFVFLQVFNSINARKLNLKDLNVFEGIKDNYYYIIVQSFIIFGQIILVNFGGIAVRTQPLSFLQHICCILIASMSLVVGFLIKLIPIFKTKKMIEIKDENEEINEIEINKEKNYILKRDSSISPKVRKNNYNKIEIDLEQYKNSIDKNFRITSPKNIERKRNNYHSNLVNITTNNDKKNYENYNIKTSYFKDKHLSFDNNNSNLNRERYELLEVLIPKDSKNRKYSVNSNNSDNIESKKKNIFNSRFNSPNKFKKEKKEIKNKNITNKKIIEMENKEFIQKANKLLLKI